ncbi:Ferrous iron transport protein B [invertebrate metagenome]|uniref:Ferrous iron transport protein B n=1 Tax=invertebrate metagenome TaxID=1711999 RepID=A0A484H5I6_9ZZZZ
MATNGVLATALTFSIVGNPNCGKTTLFNALTGARQEVGNWPGVTVERKIGVCKHGEETWRVVDLPGIYALDGGRSSEDERVARDYILSNEAAVTVNIVDAANLERNLYLTSQLLEMRVPIVVAVNMMDIAERRHLDVDIGKLQQALGCSVVALVASRRRGLDSLKEAVRKAAEEGHAGLATHYPTYGPAIEAAVAALVPQLGSLVARHRLDSRWLAIRLLEGDSRAAALADPNVLNDVTVQTAALVTAMSEDSDILIADSRYAFVSRIVGSCVHRSSVVSRTASDWIDRIVLNRFLGIPIFLAMIYVMFTFTLNIGGAFVNFFEQIVGTVLVDSMSVLLRKVAAHEAVAVVLADGIGGGIRTVATFVPIIGFLYLFLSFLEDSGYMARAAFVMDRGMRAIGLPGKAFVPLLVGFGCNVPAIMATRTIEHRRDRILTMMMTPFMSCGARLPVYALLAAIFFPASGQNVVFVLYLIGILCAIGTGLVLKRTLLAGETAPFVMELPPYHLPTLATVGLRAWHRLKDFVLRAGLVIVPMVMVLSILGTMGPDGSFNNRDSDRSILAKASQSLMPAFAPMGLTGENWPAAVGLMSGLLAKEAVVGTLNALYANIAASEAGIQVSTHEQQFNPGAKLWAALLSVPTNLASGFSKLMDPMNLEIGFVAETGQVAEVASGVFGAMAARFDDTASAFAYLLLVLFYAPCVAALGAISHEAGWRWAAFSAAWGTGLGYTIAVLFYKAMTFERDPLASGLWIAGSVSLLGMVLVITRGLSHGNRSSRAEAASFKGERV